MNDNNDTKLLPDDIDALVNIIEAGGVNWYLLGGCAQVEMFITFEIGKRTELSPELQTAMCAFNAKFRASERNKGSNPRARYEHWHGLS